MTQMAMEELLKQCKSAYKLVILAAKRAKEIAEGSPPLVETDKKKITSIALEEILAGKVQYQPEEAESSHTGKSRSRASKAKEKKRAAA
jgi:DNA-directed RNA polymerase subunit omega